MFRLMSLKQEDSLASLGTTILQRGSTRRFTPKSIPFEHLSAILSAAGSPIPLDTGEAGSSLVEVFFIANLIEGLPSGSYRFDKKEGAVDQLKLGKFRDMSGYLCLDQPLFGDASAVFFLMSDLRGVTETFGNRGYRLAQFEAGIRAGKIYLSSYALGNGASGSTFYDDAVTEFFSPEAKGLSAMIAVGIGVPAYKAKPGKILLKA
jgi:Nitroreductase family